MGTGVSAPEALVLICAIKICFAITGLVGGGGVSVVCQGVSVARIHFPAFQISDATRRN